MAGASKDSVELEMGTGGFCVKGEAEGVRYENCFTLAHEVKPDAAQAKFESGLLTIDVPFRGAVRGHHVTIQ
jgi:HSP20 family molecular chaperone IbpA